MERNIPAWMEEENARAADAGVPTWMLDEEPEEEDVEYSTARQSVSTFFEGAIGLGTEADALLRMMSDGMSYDEALKESQKRMSAFKEDNEALATAAEWGGIAAGFLVPGGVLAKSGQAVSKARQVGMAAAEGAAMGAAYQYAAEDIETGERGFMTGAALGGTLGGVAGKFLLKNADELQKMEDEMRNMAGRGTEIWGDDGIVDTPTRVKDRTRVSANESSAMERQRGIAGDGAKPSALVEKSGQVEQTFDYLSLGTREFVEKYAGKRAGRLVSLAEQQMRLLDREVVKLSDEFLEEAMTVLDANPKLYEEFVNIGYARKPGDVGPELPRTVADVASMARGDDANPIAKMVDLFTEANSMELAGWREGKLADYFPREAKGAMAKGVQARFDDYENPAVAVKSYVTDVMNARILANTFFKQDADDILAKLKPAHEGQSRMDAVINEIERAAAKQGGNTAQSADAAHNLAVGLRSSMIAAKEGGNSVGSAVRKLSSTGLLANWSNAMLNTIEGVTLPIYMNGIKATAQTMLPAVRATVNSVGRQFGKDNVLAHNWVDNEAMGLGRQFMGEVHADADKQIGKMIEDVSSFFYKFSGVQTVNEMGQEILGNSAVKAGQNLAKRALKTGDYSKLAQHPAARGMTQSEIRAAARGLATGDANNPKVREWYTQALGLGQPAYSSSMPMGFNNHPNGRAFYGMLSYMNRQYNRIRTDIYQNARDVAKHGVNTPKGREALKSATRNAVVYAATMGLANGVWDDFRKGINDATERDYLGDGDIRGYQLADINEALMFMGDTTLNQLASNVSSGMLNVRSEEFGGETFNPMQAPAFNMGVKGVNAAIQAAGGDFDPAGRFLQTYVPGASQADRVSRALTGERLMDQVLGAQGMLSPEQLQE